MHFSIPDTQLCRDSSGSFVTYNIHINGSFHCSLRYRQLYQFHLQLKNTFGGASLCPFPPKKLFSLNQKQLEERRSALEKFLQIASQDSEIVASPLFNDYLLSAQQDTHLSCETLKPENVTKVLEIHQQLNSVQTTVRLPVEVCENSETVLRRWSTVLGLSERYLPYFCLYLVRRVDGPTTVDFRVVRRLANYESPYLTLVASEKRKDNLKTGSENGDQTNKTSNSYLVMIRKSYWDPALDEDLFGDKVALGILYLIAHHEVEKGHVVASKEQRHRLTALQAMGDKVEYLRLARTLKFYGYVHFEQCSCDHLYALSGSKLPEENSTVKKRTSAVKICAGNQELVVRVIGSNEETVFRVIRIKCWRLTTTSSKGTSAENSTSASSNGESSSSDQNVQKYELSFEYLVSQGILTWITISSPQAVLISTCLQAMVEEMLVRREGKKFRSEGLSLHYHTSPSFSGTVTASTSNDTPDSKNKVNNTSSKNGSQPEANEVNKSSTNSSSQSSSPIDFVEPSNVLKDSNNKVRYSRLVENNVFDEIGEEDL